MIDSLLKLCLICMVLVLPVSRSVVAQDSELEGAAEVERNIDPAELNLAMIIDPTLRFEIEDALQRQDYGRAEQLIVNEIEKNPDAPKYELLTYLGGLFFVDKKYLNSAVAFKKAEEIQPLDAGNRFTLAMSYVLLGRRDWARPELEKLTTDQPENPIFPYWLARLDYDDNEYASAVGRLEALLEKFPDHVRGYDRLALCHEALGNNELAIEFYEKAIELNRKKDPAWVWPPLNLGVLLIQIGKWEEAEASLREAVSIDPEFAQAHYRLGLALEKLSRFEESAKELSLAASLDVEYPDPHWALGRVLRRIGDKDGAAAAVKRYRELKSKEKAVHQGP